MPLFTEAQRDTHQRPSMAAPGLRTPPSQGHFQVGRFRPSTLNGALREPRLLIHFRPEGRYCLHTSSPGGRFHEFWARWRQKVATHCSTDALLACFLPSGSKYRNRTYLPKTTKRSDRASSRAFSTTETRGCAKNAVFYSVFGS